MSAHLRKTQRNTVVAINWRLPTRSPSEGFGAGAHIFNIERERMKQPIKGFSKLTKQAKIEWLVNHYAGDPTSSIEMLSGYWHNQPEVQKLHDEFIENTISNYYMPFGVAPNFLINGKLYAIPLAIEESSVVAAAAKAANFWLDRGGFSAKVLSMVKVGHVHFIWEGKNVDALYRIFAENQHRFFENTESITKNMRARGGGVMGLDLKDKTDLETGYFQIEARFETCDSMGANFINSCLESFAQTLRDLAAANPLHATFQQLPGKHVSFFFDFGGDKAVAEWVSQLRK